MLNQTLALFLDAYRQLNSRKMFWIAIILSTIGLGVFAGLHISGGSLRFFSMDISSGFPPLPVYKVIFTGYFVKFWLGIAVTVLALVSTAGIFPDFMEGGSIDLYLSKPISRLRLFFTKYIAGLMFVLMQVTYVCIAAYFLMGWRAGYWQLGLFTAIPVLLLFYSYLFAICVLLGVWWRSTIGALLVTIVLWLVIWALNLVGDQILLVQKYHYEFARGIYQQKLDQSASVPATRPSGWFTAQPMTAADAQAGITRADRSLSEIMPWYNAFHTAALVLPKTTATVDLLNRVLFEEDEATNLPGSRRARSDDSWPPETQAMFLANERVQDEDRHRSLWSTIGTSLLFEAVVLALAARSFCKRDF